jgi:hypothetical protein
MKKFISILLLSLILCTPILALADEPEEPATEETTTTNPDSDEDGISDSNDNCKNTRNPNQLDKNENGIGDACDRDYQASLERQIQRQIEAIENSIPNLFNTTRATIDFGKACTANTNLAEGTTACTAGANSDPKFKKLDNALKNKSIISVLEEPLSTENIFSRAQICTTNYLRDANGFLKFTNVSLGNIAIDYDNPAIRGDNSDSIDFSQTAEARIYRDALSSASNYKVAIGIDTCETKYVQTCSPQFTYIREITLGNPLPTIVTCDRVQLLFGESGIDLLKQYVGLIYRWATGIVGIIAVFIIMIQGIIISTAGGDDGKIGEAKSKIIESLTAIAILFLSGIILYTINPNYFTTSDLQEQLKEQQTTVDPNNDEAPEPEGRPVPGQEDGRIPTA